MTPDLGAPAVRGKATVNSIAAACTKAAFPGNYATSSGRAQEYRAKVFRRVAEFYRLDPLSPRGFVEFAITRDSDGTPRIILGEYEWDHQLPRDRASEFERRATNH